MTIDLTRFLDRFRQETRERLNAFDAFLAVLERDPSREPEGFGEAVAELRRLAHAIKGSARMMGYNGIDGLCHSVEDLLMSVRSSGSISRQVLELLVEARRGIDRLLSVDREVADEAGQSPGWLADLDDRLHRAAGGGSVKKVAADVGSAGVGDASGGVEPEQGGGAESTDGSPARRRFPMHEGTIRVAVEGVDDILQGGRELRRTLEELRVLGSAVNRLSDRSEGQNGGGKERTPEPGSGHAKKGDIGRELALVSSALRDNIGDLDREIAAIERGAVALRMRPIEELFRMLPPHARELAGSLNKAVRVDFTGGEVLLDGRIVELLEEPLIHVIRNAVDHGIESPEEREKRGKKKEGWIWISARENAGWARITVADDGRGIDLREVWKLAAQLGLTDNATPSRRELKDGYRFLFDDRFTSRRSASSISGRGIGMAAARRRLQELRGDVTVESEPGLVTRIIMTVPASLSSQSTLVTAVRLKSGERLFIGIPAAMVRGTANRQAKPGSREERSEALKSGRGLPEVSLSSAIEEMDVEAISEGERYQVAVSDGVRGAELAVSEIISQTDAVIEPLPLIAQSNPLIAGASILAQESIMLILNVPALMTRVYARYVGVA